MDWEDNSKQTIQKKCPPTGANDLAGDTEEQKDNYITVDEHP